MHRIALSFTLPHLRTDTILKRSSRLAKVAVVPAAGTEIAE